MKKFILLLAGISFLISCSKKEEPQNRVNSEYQYIEIRQEQSFTEPYGPLVEAEAELIRAPHDSLAYLEAFKLFILSNATNVKNIESGVPKFIAPVDFKLLNKEGKDIAKSVTFVTKEAKENEIFDQYIGE